MELVTRNVAAQVKAPPIPRKRRQDLTIEGAKRLLTVLEGERLEALFVLALATGFVLALATGLRRGELLVLHWKDVDLESRELRVIWALQRVEGRLQFVDLKTESADRTVSIPKFALPYLKRHRARQRREQLALGEAWQDHGLVFASTIGTPIEPRNVTRRWETLRERAELDGLRLHDLRHGCATFMHAAGFPPAPSCRAPAKSLVDVR